MQWPLTARAFLEMFNTVLPVMNPIGCALLYPQLSAGITPAERSVLARRIAVNTGLVLMVAMWGGAALLSVLGIDSGALRIAGGLVVSVQAWHLFADARPDAPAPALSPSAAAFVPLTIPFTTGPGTLAAAAALGAARPAPGGDLLAHIAGMSAAALALAALVAVLYGLADRAISWLGPKPSQALAQLCAFLLLCVGVQIVVRGVHEAWP